MVTEHAVERRKNRFALGRSDGLGGTDQREHLAQEGIKSAARQPGHSTDAPINKAGDAAGRLIRSDAERTLAACDVVVQVLDEAGQSDGRVHGQSGGAAQVGGTQVAARRAGGDA